MAQVLFWVNDVYFLDLLTGWLSVAIAVSFISLWILSSPDHRLVFPLPGWLRFFLLSTSVGVLYRGIELVNLSHAKAMVAGHVDQLGALVSVSMALTIGGFAFHALQNRHTRAVIEMVKAVGPLEQVPEKGEALAVLSLTGSTVAAPGASETTPPAAERARAVAQALPQRRKSASY